MTLFYRFFFFFFLDVILHSHVKEENVTVIGLLYTYLTVKGFSNFFFTTSWNPGSAWIEKNFFDVALETNPSCSKITFYKRNLAWLRRIVDYFQLVKLYHVCIHKRAKYENPERVSSMESVRNWKYATNTFKVTLKQKLGSRIVFVTVNNKHYLLLLVFQFRLRDTVFNHTRPNCSSVQPFSDTEKFQL